MKQSVIKDLKRVISSATGEKINEGEILTAMALSGMLLSTLLLTSIRTKIPGFDDALAAVKEQVAAKGLPNGGMIKFKGEGICMFKDTQGFLDGRVVEGKTMDDEGDQTSLAACAAALASKGFKPGDTLEFV